MSSSVALPAELVCGTKSTVFGLYDKCKNRQFCLAYYFMNTVPSKNKHATLSASMYENKKYYCFIIDKIMSDCIFNHIIDYFIVDSIFCD